MFQSDLSILISSLTKDLRYGLRDIYLQCDRMEELRDHFVHNIRLLM